LKSGAIVREFRHSFLLENTTMPRVLGVIGVLTALFMFPATAVCQDSETTQPISSLERSALNPSRGMLVLGKSVADSACASCHGSDGVSPSPGVPHLAGQRTVYLYRVLQAYQFRERHNDAMNHATGFLNEEALLAVSAYYASLAPARPQSTQDRPVEAVDAAGGDPFAGIREDMKKCVKCHGEDGNAGASGMPNLTAQDPAYFVASMKGYVDGTRNHGLMKKLAADLDDATLTAKATSTSAVNWRNPAPPVTVPTAMPAAPRCPPLPDRMRVSSSRP
jgi:cytochrome c553